MSWSPSSSQSGIPKEGNEAFREQNGRIELTVLDFWQWANSNLLDNAARGILAEFLVAHALERTHMPRREWGAFDIKTESGLKIEVKSASYAQSWPQERPSKIVFNIAPRKSAWDAESNDWESFDRPRRPADVYVFCLLGQPDDPDPDPLDLAQWRFYILGRQTLDLKCPGQKTISLNPLRSLVRRMTGRSTTPYRELATVINMLGKDSR